eukprot:UN01005
MQFDETIDGCNLTTFINEWTTILSAMPQDIVQSASCRFLQFKNELVYKTFNASIDVTYNNSSTNNDVVIPTTTTTTTQGITLDDIPEPVLNALIIWFNKVSIGNDICIVDNMIPNLDLSTEDWIIIDLNIVKNDACTKEIMNQKLLQEFQSYGEEINVNIRTFENYPDGPYDNQFKCAKNDDAITFMNVYKQQSINNKCKVLTWDHWDAPFNGKYYSMLFDSNIDGCTIEQFVAEWTIILSEMPQDVVESAGCRPLKLLGQKVYETNKATIIINI